MPRPKTTSTGVETNYIVNLGRLAEVEGESAIWWTCGSACTSTRPA
jgi:hypothetical protein